MPCLFPPERNKKLKSQNDDLKLKIRENDQRVVQKTKYTGVQIDCNLEWKEQIKAISAKVSRAVGFLKHAKLFLPREASKALYTSVVEPHFRHCCSVSGCAGSTEINQLQKLQKRSARIVTNSSYDTNCRPLIERLGWKTIQELTQNESETMVFKSLNGLAPPYLRNHFTKNSECCPHSLHNTTKELRLRMYKTANGQNYFSFRGPKLWNSLSAESKHVSSLNIFEEMHLFFQL